MCNCYKDDENTLLKALSSVWFCDQIVFLADRSTKRSIEIAKRFNCDIHQWTGENSMSARRNYAMKHMKHDYILMCDSDEIYDWSTYEILREYMKKPDDVSIFAVRLVNVTTDGEVQSVTPLERMFKKDVKWENPIQNQLWAPSNEARIIENNLGVVTLYHDGYGDAAKHAMKQWERIPLNEASVRDNDDTHTRMFLINALTVAGANQYMPFERILANVEVNIAEFDKSEKSNIDCKILQKTLRFYYCSCGERGKWGVFLDKLQKYYHYVDYHPDSIYWMHRCNYELRRPKDATKYGEKFIKAIDNPEIAQKNIEVTTLGLRDEVIHCMICCWQNTEPRDNREKKYLEKRVKYWMKKL